MNIEQIHKNATEIKHGLCLSMSYLGIRPSELEKALEEANTPRDIDMSKDGSLTAVMGALNLPTSAMGAVSSTKDQILSLMGLGLAVGAAGGVGTAIVRHKLENIADNSEDEEMRKKNMRLKAYKNMINELKTDIASE